MWDSITDWLIGIAVIGAFASFIYHRIQAKKDGRGYIDRMSGGRRGKGSTPFKK